MSPNSTQHYTIQNWSQKEQEGGFWLISVTINITIESPPHEFDFGSQFCIENSTIPLFLFQQTLTKQSVTLQFLSDQALAKKTSPQCLNITPPTFENQYIINACQTSQNIVMLGSELRMANVFYLAKIRSTARQNQQTLALLHNTKSFPFRVKPALIMAPNLPPEAIGTSSLLEDWKIPNRLASQSDLPGCFDDTLDQLFAYWLAEQNRHRPEPWHIIICASKETKKKCLAVSQSYDWAHALDIHRETFA